MKFLDTRIGDWFAALFLVTVIYVLVRPQSAAADAIKSFSDAMVAIVKTATQL